MESRYLFRAKRIDNGKWVQGAVLFHDDVATIFSQHPADGSLQGFEVDINTICQCTGLKDKNGNLIWENDIIEKEFYSVPDSYMDSTKYMGTIQYEDGGWYVNVVTDDIAQEYQYRISLIEAIANTKDLEHFEIIGNSFDNPELLMEEEKEVQEKID